MVVIDGATEQEIWENATSDSDRGQEPIKPMPCTETAGGQ